MDVKKIATGCMQCKQKSAVISIDHEKRELFRLCVPCAKNVLKQLRSLLIDFNALGEEEKIENNSN